MFFKLFEGCKIYLQFNFDGLLIHKSTSKCFWPIHCRARVNMISTSVVLVGLFFGKGKPEKCSVFLRQLKDLRKGKSDSGLIERSLCCCKFMFAGCPKD